MYTASVVQKVSASFKRIAVVCEHFQGRILEPIIKTPQKSFNDIYQSKFYNGEIEEVIEKIVILSHLDGRSIREWIEAGFNPLKKMFLGQYEKDYTIEEIQQGFEYFNSHYKDILNKALIQDIERIPYMSNRGRKTIPVTESVKKIEGQKGGFIVGYYQDKIKSNIICEMLLKQIIKNINKKISMGISQKEEVLAFEQVGKREYSSYNVEIIKRLMTEANMQLKIAKLPKEFRKYEDMIKSGVSVETFYSHIKTQKLPDFGKKEIEGVKFSENKDGELFGVIGNGELPEELKGKSIKQMEKLGLKKLYETPMDLDGTPSVEDFKTKREKVKVMLDYLDENNKEDM